jgi:hypothetical protein
LWPLLIIGGRPLVVEEKADEGGLMNGPIILIVLGVLFLLNNLYPGVFRFSRMWPVILIVIGVVRIGEQLMRRNLDNKEQK